MNKKGTFSWAVEQMKEGKKVVYSDICSSKYCYADKFNIIRDDDCHEFRLSIKSFEATDWEIYKEPKETLYEEIQKILTADNSCDVVRIELMFKKRLKEFISHLVNRNENEEVWQMDIREKAQEIFGNELAGDR